MTSRTRSFMTFFFFFLFSFVLIWIFTLLSVSTLDDTENLIYFEPILSISHFETELPIMRHLNIFSFIANAALKFLSFISIFLTLFIIIIDTFDRLIVKPKKNIRSRNKRDEYFFLSLYWIKIEYSFHEFSASKKFPFKSKPTYGHEASRRFLNLFFKSVSFV